MNVRTKTIKILANRIPQFINRVIRLEIVPFVQQRILSVWLIALNEKKNP